MRQTTGIYQRLSTGRYYQLEIDKDGRYLATPWSIKNNRRRRGMEYGMTGQFNPIEWQFMHFVLDNSEYPYRGDKTMDDAADFVGQEVTELTLFIENDSELYHSIILPTCEAMAKKVVKGTYDERLALISWMHVATAGARKYGAEHLRKGELTKVFSVATRENVAAHLMQEYQEHINEFVKDIRSNHS